MEPSESLDDDVKVTVWSTIGSAGLNVNAGVGATLGGSITSTVLLIVSVPPSRSSTRSETVCGPPDVKLLETVAPVASKLPSSSRSQRSVSMRLSGSVASDVNVIELPISGAVGA